QLHAVGNTRFSTDNGLLQRSDSLEEQRKNQQAGVDAGVKINVQSRHVEVSLYGNTAVSTRYGVGTVTQPNGTVVQLNNRITAVLIKQGGQWKVVHQHFSPVVLPQ
ncbi:MAG: nuclear transport factor 2 family protein, partial [Acidobacteria bacterium]|nr:nuclear transport factor 2 family protein [Acidobacteriota bacterium]